MGIQDLVQVDILDLVQMGTLHLVQVGILDQDGVLELVRVDNLNLMPEGKLKLGQLGNLDLQLGILSLMQGGSLDLVQMENLEMVQMDSPYLDYRQVVGARQLLGLLPHLYMEVVVDEPLVLEVAVVLLLLVLDLS